MTPPSGESRLDAVSRAVIAAFPKLSAAEQRVSLALYRLLARGRPADLGDISDASGVAVDDAREMIARWHGVERSPNGAVTGFWGLTLAETRHRFRIDGSDLHTWCAWDTLFLPPLFGTTAGVVSECPVTSRRVVLKVGPTGIQSARPRTTALSFVVPRASEIERSVIESFCCHVHFFASPEAGEQWIGQRPGTFLLSLSDAWQIGIRKSAAQFGDVR